MTTHTVYEAKQLECRQAFSCAHTISWGKEEVKDTTPIWYFPRCSASACAHWLFTDQKETRKVVFDNKNYNEESWKAYIDGEIANGWKPTGSYAFNDTAYYHHLRLVRPLPLDKQRGRCGLIPDITVEVNP